jgi:hypothetical protein
MTTLPQLVDPAGEVIQAITADDVVRAAGLELHVADKIDLATFMDGCAHLEAIAKEAREDAGQEMIRRLDRDGAWTYREGGLEVKAPSPAAGTTRYDTDALREALEQLVAEDVISGDAARNALEPIWPTAQIDQPTLKVLALTLGGIDNDGRPLDPDTDQAMRRMALETVEAAIEQLAEVTYKQKPAGIKALLKIPAAAAAVDACKVEVAPPARKATIRRVSPDA